MKQKIHYLFMLLLMCLVANAGLAQTVTYQHVFNAKPTTGENITLTDVSWNIEATQLGSYNSGNYAGVQIGSKNNDGSITLTSFSDWNYKNKSKITEVRLWLNLGGTSVTPTVTIGGKAATSDGTTVVKNSSAGSDWTKTTKVTFTPAADGNTGVVVINVATVKAGYICAMEIDCEEAGGSTIESVSTPTFLPEAGTYTSAQDVTINCATKGVTIYYTTDGSAPTTSSSVYSSAIHVDKTTTIKAVAVKDGMNNSEIVTSVYTINKPLVTIDEIGNISFDLSVNGWGFPTTKKLSGAYSNSGYTLTLNGPAGEGFLFDKDNLMLGKTDATLSLPSFDFDVEKIEFYGPETGSKSVTQNIYVGDKAVSTETTGCKGKNTYNIASDYQKAGNIYTLKVTNPNNTRINRIIVYKASVDERSDVTLSYSDEAFSVTKGEGGDFPQLSVDPEAAASEVVYSSSNLEVAEVANDGVVTPKAAGTTIITAKIENSKTYKDATASYTLTVVDPNAPGTQNNPYTVAQARAAIDASSGVTGVYAKGIVSEIVTAYNSQYGNISYNISTDGTTTADQLQAYRGMSYNGEKFTSEDDVQVGDVVVVYGNLKKYNSTYEFDANNQLVSLERKVLADAELAFEKEAYDLFLGEEFVAPLLINPHSVTVTYSSSDENIATVNAETGEVTIHTKGVTTISATSSATDTYKAGNASYTLTVKRELVENEIFYESFDNFNATGGNDEKWSGSIASGTFDKEDSPADNVGWTSVTANAANKCAKIGSGNNGGSIETPAIQGLNGDATITFLAGGWDKTGEQKILKLYIDNGTITPEVVTVEAGKFSEYKVDVKDATPGSKIKFAVENKENRIFIDEISIVKNAVPEPITLSAPIIFHDGGEYEGTLTVAMAGEGTIMYKLGADGKATAYTAPITINATTTVTAWAEKDGVKSDEVSKTFTIVPKQAGAEVADGYYNIKTSDGKYVNVAGRKTVTLASDAKSAGTVIRVSADANGVKVLRSQGVDVPGYAKKAMNYVPEIVQLAVDKLHAEGSGAILGEHGLDAIMEEFNKSFDYNLYLEKSGDAYRIYGRTPSMKPVVDFYAKNKANVDAKLPQLEAFINSAIDKVLEKTGNRGASILVDFKLHDVWQNMDGTLTEPVDEASTMKFYEEVLSSETNVWNFAYQTAMIYWGNLKYNDTFKKYIGKLGDYAKYIDKVENIRPNFKYYIVPSGSGVDFISEGNEAITGNNASAAWAMEPVTTFQVELPTEKNVTVYPTSGGTQRTYKEYYTTLYTDFAYTLPEGVKAYKVTAIDEKTGVAKREEITGTIPAQTPVLLVGVGESNTATLTLSTEAGTAITGNLLVGPDALINEYQIQTPQVVSLFEFAKEILGESAYKAYVEKYEHLMLKNAGTVNNKYFFGLTEDDLGDVTNLRILGMGYENELGFHDIWEKIDANKAFILTNDYDPVKLFLVGDVNRDGAVSIADVTALVNIILGKAKYPEDNDKYDFEAANVNGDKTISIADVTALVNIILGK